MRSAVSAALERYNANAPTIPFDLVLENRDWPENVAQRDMDHWESTVDWMNDQIAIERATQALEAFNMT